MSEGCQPAVDSARLGLRPRNFEILAAPPAGHAAGPSGERLPLSAARADGVAIVAALGEAHGVVWPGPPAPPRRGREHACGAPPPPRGVSRCFPPPRAQPDPQPPPVCWGGFPRRPPPPPPLSRGSSTRRSTPRRATTASEWIRR